MILTLLSLIIAVLRPETTTTRSHACGETPVPSTWRATGPRVIEAWIADLRQHGYAANTIAGRITAVSAFYRWCVREERIDRNPIDVVRRPRRPNESTTVSLTRHELTDWLAAAEARGGSWWAAAMLLGLNGLRCSELIACDVTDVGSHSWHHTLALRTTKGDRPTVVALAPPTMQAIAAATGSRNVV